MRRAKTLVAAIASMLCVALLVGCGTGSTGSVAQTADDRIQVVCATFPAYDWARNVIGNEADRFELTYLMRSGVDLHSFQPTVEDMAKVSDADLFVYVGGESDEWAADAIELASNPDLHAVSMLEAVGSAAVEEEVVEGMQAEEDEAHANDDEAEYDEHVWLSLRNAQTLVSALAAELGDIDPEHAGTYGANAAAYNESLSALDARYAAAVDAASGSTLVFADRFPFRYLTEDYGLAYYAAFAGCSAETEASFETVAFLARTLDELGVGTVLVIENSDQQFANTVVASTQSKDQQVRVLDSLQSASAADIEAGKTYLGTMEDNLDVLTTALA